MVKQYPYRLEVLSNSESTQDAYGNNIPAQSQWSFYSVCRDEAGNGKQVSGADGIMVVYSFLVQMPKGIEALNPETRIRVVDENGIERCYGKIIYARKDQLHTRAWV